MVIYAEQLGVEGDVHGCGTFLMQGLGGDAQVHGLEGLVLEGFGFEMAKIQRWQILLILGF